MKITITGALGNIGKPLIKSLIAKGHAVTGIDYKTERYNSLVELGAFPAIGDLADVEFLIKSFEGADAVFIMYPSYNYFDPDLNLMEAYKEQSKNYVKAILAAKVYRVVNLSSIGAHLRKGNGMIKAAYYVEQILNELPPDVSITHIRPSSFFTNLYGYMNTIKSDTKIYASFGSRSIPWTSPRDIADVVAEELTQWHAGRNNRYVASEELTGEEIAAVIGKAIEKPELKWQLMSDEELENTYRSAGISSVIAAELTEMYAALGSGLMIEDYKKNKPKRMGRVKLKDFAKDFARVYDNNR